MGGQPALWAVPLCRPWSMGGLPLLSTYPVGSQEPRFACREASRDYSPGRRYCALRTKRSGSKMSLTPLKPKMAALFCLELLPAGRMGTSLGAVPRAVFLGGPGSSTRRPSLLGTWLFCFMCIRCVERSPTANTAMTIYSGHQFCCLPQYSSSQKIPTPHMPVP